jgi:hypothetical protein
VNIDNSLAIARVLRTGRSARVDEHDSRTGSGPMTDKLVGAVIANAESREELTASRARVVAAGATPAAASSATCTTARSSAW